MRHPLLALSLFLAQATSAPAQATWSNRTPAHGNPSARWSDAIAYDGARQRTVLFGGNLSASNDCWEWDGAQWRNRTPTSGSPSKRRYTRLAFDSSRDRIVLFGGWEPAGTPLADTWEWDGAQWKELTPNTGNPGPRFGMALAYDSARRRLVMFGGQRGASHYLSDTWEWDGATWVEKPASGFHGPPRAFHNMAYDARRQRVVLFGGRGFREFGDTWEWDGANWYDVTPTTGGPAAREHHAMVYDASIGRVVLFGGRSGGGAQLYPKTWMWDGVRWSEIPTPRAPSPRLTSMAFDSARGVAVLFGGWPSTTPTDDTWEFAFSQQAASFRIFGTACGPTPQIHLAPAAGSRALLGHALELRTTNATNNFAGLMTAGVLPVTPIPLDGLGMTGCFLYHSFDAAWLFPIRGGVGTAKVPIPYLIPLLGEKFYVQSATDRVASNAGEVVIGVR